MGNLFQVGWASIAGLILLLFSGCDSVLPQEQGTQNQESNSFDSKLSGGNTSDSNEEIAQAPKPQKTTPPNDPNALLTANGSGGGGGGGGSQGHLNRAGTGNDDNDEPKPYCGDREQNQISKLPTDCPHLVYGTTATQDTTPSNLVYFDLDNGAAIVIAPIVEPMVGVSRIGAIDFDPNGQLYGVGHRVDNSNPVLVKIDCRTGVAELVGTGFLGSQTLEVSDISFDSHGKLIAYIKNSRGGGIEQIGALDKFLGTYSPITGPTGESGDASAIFFRPFPDDALFHINNSAGDVSTLDENTGVSDLSGPSISGLAQLSRFFGADTDIVTDTTYVTFRNPMNSTFLATLASNGEVSTIGPPDVPTLSNLDGVATNRKYEVCDSSEDPPTEPLPVGTMCERCELKEMLCNDGDDNDLDGLVDCADPDCNEKACDDGLECTSDSVCSAGRCLSSPIICNDWNPCTDDSCVEPENPQDCSGTGCCEFVNVSTLNEWGQCEQDGRSCTIGKCVVEMRGQTAYCFEQPRKFISGEDGGCNDENQCTADSCIESWKKNDIIFAYMDAAEVPWGSTAEKDEAGNVILDNDWQCSNEVMGWASCFAEDKCSPGECVVTGTGMPGNEFSVSCQALPDSSPQAQCPNLDGNACTIETCDTESGGCESTFARAMTPCDDYNNCTTSDQCDGSGLCIGTPVDCTPMYTPEGGRPTPNPCQIGSCGPDGNCQYTVLADGTPAGGPCVALDPSGQPKVGKCGEGALVCMGGEPSDMCASLFMPSIEICDDGQDNDCDGLTDCADTADCPAQVACDDGASCTIDICDVVNGVGTCRNSRQDILCDDGFSCTNDGCNPTSGSADPMTGCIFSRDDGFCFAIGDTECTPGCNPTAGSIDPMTGCQTRPGNQCFQDIGGAPGICAGVNCLPIIP